jgi:hypothetical protein
MSDLPVSPSIISSRSDSHVARQVYATASSLSTRRAHLASHESEYLDIIQRYGWENKLPKERIKQLAKQRAENLQRIPFSVLALTDQLVRVIVSNDLVRQNSSLCIGVHSLGSISSSQSTWLRTKTFTISCYFCGRP